MYLKKKTLKKPKSKERHNYCKNEFRVISHVYTYSPLVFIKNMYFEFQVHMFSDGIDMTKYQSFAR